MAFEPAHKAARNRNEDWRLRHLPPWQADMQQEGLRNASMSELCQNTEATRLLVAIASYGIRNAALLKRVIQRYQCLPMQVEVVVLSEAPKDLGPEIEVVVGLPSKNPWSLPFAHKSMFAQRLEQYDLFAYSEDDMEVTEANIRAFLRVTPELMPDEVAGFLRYEVDKSGNWSLPDIHASYHWKPDSVRRRGPHMVAEFTNEHAAFYLLTQAQLRHAIASGGFLREPYEGRHDMLCAAATDPYTNCGLCKVICISSFEDFLIHHLSDRYSSQVGLPLSSLGDQISTLTRIGQGTHAATVLCGVESKLRRLRWSKSYYEPPHEAVLAAVPLAAKSILSVGCGWGATEAVLKRRGAQVTALPLDSVIGAEVERRAIDVIYGSLAQCMTRLNGQKFDCVFISNLLHLQPRPEQLLLECAAMVQPDGTLVILNPSFNSLQLLMRRALGRGEAGKLWRYAQSGVSVYGANSLRRQLKKAGFRVFAIRWLNLPRFCGPPRKRNLATLRRCLGRFMAEDWVLQARR